MKKYVVVSTYPKSGTKNIGDQLITNSLIDGLYQIKGNKITVKVIWRADKWDNVKSEVADADVVIFACLAIRENMTYQEYPFINELLKLNIPLAVISAGTSLPVSSISKSSFDATSAETVKSLLLLDKKSIVFSTRGVLTQQFCEMIGMVNARFSGDIAFLNDGVNSNPISIKNKFKNKDIKNIVISDPHYSKYYTKSLKTLITGLKREYPSSSITIALHGNDKLIRTIAHDEKIEVISIFEDKDSGLSIYDNADLHVGYRVHAHVSCLKRGVYSYLLEQDGRGCDYGLTLDKKISVPSYRQTSKVNTLINKILGYFKLQIEIVPVSPAEQIVSMIKHDMRNGFSKFNDFEDVIKVFQTNVINDINRLP